MFKGADDLNTATVENPESENAWYRLYFVNREHQHFISDDRDDPFVMSVIREVDQQSFYQVYFNFFSFLLVSFCIY